MQYRSNPPALRAEPGLAAVCQGAALWQRVSRWGRLPALLILAAIALIVASPRAPSATSSSGWSAWTATAGPTSVAPAIAFDPAGGTLELASVGADLGVSHTRFAGGKWNAADKTGQSTA